MITVNAVFGQEQKSLGTLGRVGENETRQIVFDCSDILAEYPGAEIVCVMQRHCDRIAYLADAVLDGNALTVTLTDADVSAPGDLRIELRALTDGKIRKSAVYMGQVVSALRGAQDRPGNPIADVLNRIDMTISRAEKSIAEADAAAKSAQTVADIVQTKLDNGDFVGAKGDKGDPGNVRDVRVAGVSMLKDGVANVPIATADAPGVVSIVTPQDSGIWNDNGNLKISLATDTEISGRSGNRKAIVCANMDYAVKAAMCDGKGAAWTEIEQKAARERMGIPGDYQLIEEIVLTEESSVARSKEPDGTPYNFSVIMLRAEFPASDKTGNINISYNIGSHPNDVTSYFLSPYKADAVKYGYSKVWVENSRYRSGWWTCVENHGQFAQYYENPMQQDKYSIADGNISGVSTGVMAAGTKITIYGVRA